LCCWERETQQQPRENQTSLSWQVLWQTLIAVPTYYEGFLCRNQKRCCGSCRIHSFFTWSDPYPYNFIIFSTFLRKRRGKNRIYKMENAFLMTPAANLPPVSMPVHNYVTINVPFVKIRNTWEYIRRIV
jgi:hypothetical protein